MSIAALGRLSAVSVRSGNGRSLEEPSIAGYEFLTQYFPNELENAASFV